VSGQSSPKTGRLADTLDRQQPLRNRR